MQPHTRSTSPIHLITITLVCLQAFAAYAVDARSDEAAAQPIVVSEGTRPGKAGAQPLSSTTSTSEDSSASDGPSPSDDSKGDDEAVEDAGSAEPEGEEPEPSPSEILVEEGGELQQQIDGLILKGSQLNEQLDSAEGEDRLVIERSLITTKIEILDTMGLLIGNFHAQEASGIFALELRKQIVELLNEIGPAIDEHIIRDEAKLAGMREQRESLAPEELLAFDQEIARQLSWLDTLYRASLDQADRMHSMGLETSGNLEEIRQGLIQRADSELGRLELLAEQIRELKARAGDPPGKPEDQAELAALEVRKESTMKSLTSLLRLMERLDLDTTHYRQQLIRSTGSITYDIFKPAVAVGLIEEGFDELQSWTRENALSLVFRGIVFVLIVSFFRLLAVLVRRILDRAFAGSQVKTSRLLRTMMVSMVSNSVTILGILVALSQLGIKMGPLLAGLGIAGFIVGFALQDSLANFAAGMMILGYRPYDVGDLIEASGVRGEVSDMSLVSTTILTIDNQTLIIPNGKIWGDVIKNITDQERRRVDMTFRVSYTDDIEHAERVFESILMDHPKVLRDPPPLIRVHKLKEDSIEFIVRPWVDTPDYWEVRWDVTREVVVRFAREGLTIPYPRQILSIDTGAASEGD